MIVGLTGTNGSGKGEVAEYLIQKGFTHYSGRAYISREIEKRGLPVNRDTLNAVSNDMRKRFGATYFVEEMFRDMPAGQDAVIESVREVPGAELIKAKGGFLIGVDADQKVRYDRITKRGSSTDHVDFDTFVAQEEREMNSTDPTKQNVHGVMKLADYTIRNDGTLEELQQKIEAVLADAKLLHKA